MKQLRWDHIGPATKVYGVAACPVGHSMSPAVHNAAFDELGLDAVYLPLRVEPSEEAFDGFLDAVLAAPWLDMRGLSVTVPHKEHALARVGPAKVDELSRAIGAINTVRIGRGGELEGFNTDYAAALESLCQAMGIEPAGLADKSVGVLGAGGVARAVVAALAHYQARITIYNRTPSRAQELAERFGAQACPAGDIPAMEHEIVINCTSVGMHPRVSETPAPLEALRRCRVVFDTIYNPPTTRLLELARQAGCTIVGGLEMFVRQAARQFEIWTDRPAPLPVMRQAMADRLEANPS
jgi:3-dehydroquinate dehydratase/shikimate dehydrogenase